LASVQPTMLQHGWLILPQLPPPHPPFAHIPAPLGQAAPLAMQTANGLTTESQQPPALHLDPGQHTCPVPPHASHVTVEELQPRLGAVQKSAALCAPRQHGWPAPPQAIVIGAQLPALQVPPVVPHGEPGSTHAPAQQQLSTVAQPPPAQHG
jgi:hypothetical protein